MDNFNFAELLRQYREHHGYSVRKMAGMIPTSKSAYQRWESGEVVPHPKDAEIYLKKLGILAPDGSLIPPRPRKWWRSRKWRWLAPFIIDFFFSIITDTRGFSTGLGGTVEHVTVHSRSTMLAFTIFFTMLFWAFFPPWRLKDVKSTYRQLINFKNGIQRTFMGPAMR